MVVSGYSIEEARIFSDRPELERQALLACEQSYSGLLQALSEFFATGRSVRPIIGLQGCQGSGKSTLAEYLCTRLAQTHDISALVLSLDDFYLSRAQRAQLSASVHPLLATRGVPGTHDTDRLMAVLEQLRTAPPGQLLDLSLPRFEKLHDDCAPKPRQLSQRVDLVILEGWCVGLPPQAESELLEPVNLLERERDPDASWRRFINDKLQTDYRAIFATIDRLIVLAPPSFDCVVRWRFEQEQGLAAAQSSSDAMNREQVAAFVQYFERLTRFSLEVLPAAADYLFRLDAQRNVIDCNITPGRRSPGDDILL